MNSPTNGGARPHEGDGIDLVDGDPQTLQRVKYVLCREFGLPHQELHTLRAIVDRIRQWSRSEPVAERPAYQPMFSDPAALAAAAARADVPQPPIALVAGGNPSNVFMIPMDLMTAPSAQDIARVCAGLAVFLLQKNKKYGDSALNPLRIFSKANPVEQIRVRIDDKLSRMFRGVGEDEDPLLDMTGYWVLLQVAEQRARDASEAEERGG